MKQLAVASHAFPVLPGGSRVAHMGLIGLRLSAQRVEATPGLAQPLRTEVQLRVHIGGRGRHGGWTLLGTVAESARGTFLWGKQKPRTPITRASVKSAIINLGFDPKLFDSLYPPSKPPISPPWRNRTLEQLDVSIGAAKRGRLRLIVILAAGRTRRHKLIDCVEICPDKFALGLSGFRWAPFGTTPLSLWFPDVRDDWLPVSYEKGVSCLKEDLARLGFRAVDGLVDEVFGFGRYS